MSEERVASISLRVARSRSGLGAPVIRSGPMGFGVVLALVLVAELGVALGTGREPGSFSGGSTSSVAAIGRTLFTEYQFAFEVTSILILVAMVGAVVLAKKEPR